MKKFIPLYSITLLGIAVVVVITQALEHSQRLSVVADLSSEAHELVISHPIGAAEPGEELSGGATTIRDTGVHAFGRVPMNLTYFDTNWIYFREGRKIFERDWYAVKKGRLLLGPQFNAPACKSCHQFDGRGRPPLNAEEEPQSLIVRLSIPHESGTIPEPTYGEQLSYYTAEDSVVAEGMVRIDYEELEGTFADGGRYSLRMPSYEFHSLGYGPIASDVQVSPRVAPATFGLGLLEAIPERTILSLADPDDRNGDGISGRPNYVYDSKTGKEILGRFGWKANQPTLEQQIFKAFHADIGITSRLYQDNEQIARRTGNNTTNAGPELEDKEFDALLFYIKLLAVPARRNWNEASVLRGKAIFSEIGCAGCHTPQFTTGVMEGYSEVSNQTIRPYTDMLLHDMGEGLADNRPDGHATGLEWRTPPLWGIGLVKAVNKHTFFLHDGRARNIEEAVLWHGGEGEASQNLYRRLRREDRSALLAFLESL